MNFYNNTQIGKAKLIDNIKILLYKEDNKIFDTINFEDDAIYLEPLFFSFFKDKISYIKDFNLIIFGYGTNQKSSIKVESDKYGRIYLPNIGWLITNEKLKEFELSKTENIQLIDEKGVCNFEYEPLLFIQDTNIEVLKYHIPLLDQFYFDEHLNKINVEIEEITKHQMSHLTQAFHLINKYVPNHFELIESVTKKVVVFNVDDNLRNSFASLSAQGIAFFNACQKDYNEVFFIDDIAHQTGHIIFNAMIYDIEEFLNVKPNYVVQELKNDEGQVVETRDIHVVFHALYTYYTTFICLDAMLENNVFLGKQKHETIGRIAFYINKCYSDLLVIDNPINSEIKSSEYFTEKGLQIYNELKNKWKEMYKKWFEVTKHFDMSNQPYNFTYSNFVELNPLKN